MTCGGGCQLRTSVCGVWCECVVFACDGASWIPRSKYSDRVPLLRGCVLLSLPSDRTGLFEGRGCCSPGKWHCVGG